jgi:hypothetical protein
LIIECPKFEKWSAKERCDGVVKDKRCIKCFRKKSDHVDGKCKGRPCKKCGGAHHHLLCGFDPKHIEARKEFRKMCKREGVNLEDEDPFIEKKVYLQTNYHDLYDSDNESSDGGGNDSSATDSNDLNSSQEDAAADLPRDGSAVLGPATQFTSMSSRQHHSHAEMVQQAIASDLMKVNEDEFSTFVSADARQ